MKPAASTSLQTHVNSVRPGADVLSAEGQRWLSSLNPVAQLLTTRIITATQAPTDARTLATDHAVVTAPFVASFAQALLAYHLFVPERLSKKTFEHLFVLCCQVQNQSAILNPATHPGADVVVENVPISLKTEGAQATHPEKIKISKLMEAGWRYKLTDAQDYRREILLRLNAHLSHYQEILCLRSFDRPAAYDYEMVSIPTVLLAALNDCAPEQFAPIGKHKSVRINVPAQGAVAFQFYLDGVDGKITLNNIRISQAMRLACWTIPKRSTAL